MEQSSVELVFDRLSGAGVSSSQDNRLSFLPQPLAQLMKHIIPVTDAFPCVMGGLALRCFINASVYY